MESNLLFKDLVENLREKKLSARELSRLVTGSLPGLYEEVLGDGTSYVIKRNGLLEEFNCDKLQASLARASDEAKSPLASAELRIFCEDVKKEADRLGRIFYTWQLRDLILEKLYKNKYYDISKSFRAGRK